jgi:hypothetical protein
MAANQKSLHQKIVIGVTHQPIKRDKVVHTDLVSQSDSIMQSAESGAQKEQIDKAGACAAGANVLHG